MSVRSCRVTIQDLDGTSYTAEVTASSLFEAVAQGLAALRKNEWVEGIEERFGVARGQTAPVASHRRRAAEREPSTDGSTSSHAKYKPCPAIALLCRIDEEILITAIVKPPDASDSSVRVVIESLVGDAPPSGPADSARVAVEMREFYDAIETLEGHPESLDEGGMVQLALALESVGQREDAIKALQSRKFQPDFTDAMGVLAGRLKRRWLVERRSDDAEKACELYQQGFELSEQAARHDQASYHGINVAFMQLACRMQQSVAQQTAKKVLEHCRSAKLDTWQLATEGEANLLLGNADAAMDGYRAAATCNPPPRQLDSMFQQAVRVASRVGNEAAADRLQEIFRGGA